MSAAVLPGTDGASRCWWCVGDPAYERYHDDEWGRPVRDERALFEKLCLEGFQAGLSWLTILRKRPAFRAAFAGFDPVVVSSYGEGDVRRLLADPGIVRNRAKIEATIGNAGSLVAMHTRGEQLADLVSSFTPAPAPPPRSAADVPARIPASAALSSALRERGFRFVGPTTVYAFMQAMGFVNDHVERCAFR